MVSLNMRTRGRIPVPEFLRRGVPVTGRCRVRCRTQEGDDGDR